MQCTKGCVRASQVLRLQLKGELSAARIDDNANAASAALLFLAPPSCKFLSMEDGRSVHIPCACGSSNDFQKFIRDSNAYEGVFSATLKQSVIYVFTASFTGLKIYPHDRQFLGQSWSGAIPPLSQA